MDFIGLGTVFMLNAVALLIFPWIGHHFFLSESQFGLSSAIAIHDTSSVVGATLQYGPHALEVGTPVKLARALWIVPIAMMIGFVKSKQAAIETVNLSEGSFKPKAKKPWFILGFLIAAGLVTWVPVLQSDGHQIESIAKKLIGVFSSYKTLGLQIAL